MSQDYYNPIRIFEGSKTTAVLNHLATTIGGTLHYCEKERVLGERTHFSN